MDATEKKLSDPPDSISGANPAGAISDLKLVKPGEIRTRIAPAPTGFLHIGTARTALFNFLFARKNQGVFILRIEDTDTERSKPEFEKNIIDSLKWLGINWDEGPDIGGQYGPYRQSEKIAVYRKYLEKLLAEDKAYYCFCREEELEARRQYQMSIGQPPRYSGKCGSLPRDEAEKRISQGEKAVIRFRIPHKRVIFEDIIRGRTEFDSSLFGDIIIARSLNDPLYNFAVIIDDYEMKISHVIRGEEHLSNTPKQILIQEALGFPRLNYAHLSLILAPDRSKLSKRRGATAVEEYRQEGYLAEALVNFIAFLGWNPGGEREIFAIPSLIKEFSLERCRKAGAIFNIRKLESLNGFYIRQKSIEKLTEACLPFLINAGLIEETDGSKETVEAEKLVLRSQGKPLFRIKESGEIINSQLLEKIIFLYQERLKRLSEISELTDFFFKKKLSYEKQLLTWKDESNEEIRKALHDSEKALAKIETENWIKENLEKILLETATKFTADTGRDRGYLLWPVRAALSGKSASAGPFEIAEVLGKDKTITRLQNAQNLT